MVLASSLEFGEDVLALLDWLSGLSGLFTKIFSVMLEIPGLEWSSVDKNDGILDKFSCSSELVISGIIDCINDSGLVSSSLSLPSEVSAVEGECSVFDVSTSSSDKSNFLGSNFGFSCLSSHFILSLLFIEWNLSS